ncbi:MAG: helix-turn-helix domain-containing protein, partial [Myxococcota bacterium]
MRKTDVDTRREHILKAASRLLQRDGYKRTTVADVAREAEVSVGSVYLEFDSKDAIVAKLALHCHEQILARMIEAATPSAPPDALQAALEARILAQHEHSGRAPHSVELLHCAACPGVKQALEHFAPRERQFVQELLEQGERQGAF